jgi:hypothetical protein
MHIRYTSAANICLQIQQRQPVTPHIRLTSKALHLLFVLYIHSSYPSTSLFVTDLPNPDIHTARWCSQLLRRHNPPCPDTEDHGPLSPVVRCSLDLPLPSADTLALGTND